MKPIATAVALDRALPPLQEAVFARCDGTRDADALAHDAGQALAREVATWEVWSVLDELVLAGIVAFDRPSPPPTVHNPFPAWVAALTAGSLLAMGASPARANEPTDEPVKEVEIVEPAPDDTVERAAEQKAKADAAKRDAEKLIEAPPEEAGRAQEERKKAEAKERDVRRQERNESVRRAAR